MKTVINSEAFLIEIEQEGQVYRMLWGIIGHDETGRWQPGDYVCTTPIQKIEDLGEGVTRFLTRSGRTYETLGEVGTYKTQSFQELQLFRMGVSPYHKHISDQLGLKIVEIES
jgi:hypothetical protein